MSKKAMVSQPMASDERLEIDSLNEDLSDTAARLSDALEYCDDMERDLARAELMHKRTAEHLREERRRRRAAEADLADAEDHLRMWLGRRPATASSAPPSTTGETAS